MPKQKDPKLVRSAQVLVKMTPGLKDRLFDAAMRRSLDTSTFARMLITEGLNACDEKRWGSHKKQKKKI